MPRWSWAQRVAAWDAALAAVRACLRGQGMREAPTPVVALELALEPWIEPVAAGSGWLQTSPELAMKRLLARGVGPIFQLAAVARAGERGAWHRECFTLLEWYRDTPDTERPRIDVEQLVAAVADALAPWRAPGADAAPSRWRAIGFLDAMHASGAAVSVRGDEDGDALVAACLGTRLELPALRCADAEARTLEAWTALFTAWSDAAFDPWLGACARAGEGVHLVEFPPALAALAEVAVDAERRVARRFESHAWGRELANGYGELRDAVVQRARFEAVAELRAAHGLPPLSFPERFLAELPALPPCAGAALGLDRLVALALGASTLAEITLDPDA